MNQDAISKLMGSIMQSLDRFMKKHPRAPMPYRLCVRIDMDEITLKSSEGLSLGLYQDFSPESGFMKNLSEIAKDVRLALPASSLPFEASFRVCRYVGHKPDYLMAEDSEVTIAGIYPKVSLVERGKPSWAKIAKFSLDLDGLINMGPKDADGGALRKFIVLRDPNHDRPAVMGSVWASGPIEAGVKALCQTFGVRAAKDMISKGAPDANLMVADIRGGEIGALFPKTPQDEPSLEDMERPGF